jgi:hypothetical protein
MAPVIALVIVLGLAACGGGSGSGSGTNASANQQPNGGRGFLSDPKVQACLKKQGVTVPSGGRRPNGGGPPNGQPPGGGNGQPPTGTNGRPQGGQGNSAQFQKLRAALQKCGVNFPNRGNGAPAPNQGTTSTSAS